MKKIEHLTFNQKNLKDNIVEESAKVFLSFKRIRTAFEPLLFLRFTCQTIVLIGMMFYFVKNLRGPEVTVERITFLLMQIGVYVLIAFITLIYESVLADDAYAAMKALLVPLG